MMMELVPQIKFITLEEKVEKEIGKGKEECKDATDAGIINNIDYHLKTHSNDTAIKDSNIWANSSKPIGWCFSGVF